MLTRFRKMLSVLLVIATVLSAGAGRADLLRLPAEVTRIEDSAFENDRSLDEAVLPEGVEYIGKRAFAGTSIRKIRLPRSLSHIEGDAFAGASVTVFEADRGTYAYQWLEDHGYVLHFSGEEMYDAVTDMAVFESDPSAGPGDDWFAAWYEIAEYEDWKDTAASSPVWTVTQISGPAAEYLLQHFDGQASLSVAMPAEPAEYTFTVSCTWEGRSVSTGATVRYTRPAELPTGTDIPDVIRLTKDHENILSFHFTPEGFAFGNMDRVGFEGYTGQADVWYEGHDLHIIPYETGTFTANVALYAGNLYIAKDVTFRVREVPEQITARTGALWDEEAGKFNLDALAPASAEGVTDADDLEIIAEFNGALPALQENAEAYNAAMDDLYAIEEELMGLFGNLTLEGTGPAFSIGSDQLDYSFSVGESVADILTEDSEIVSVTETEDGEFRLEVLNGGTTGYILFTETGIRVEGSTPRGNGGGLRARGVRGTFEQLASFLNDHQDAIVTVGRSALEILGVMNPVLAKYGNMLLLGHVENATDVLSLLEDPNDPGNPLASLLLKRQQLRSEYDELWEIFKEHGHPTDMEWRDPVMKMRAFTAANSSQKALEVSQLARIALEGEIMISTYMHLASIYGLAAWKGWSPRLESAAVMADLAELRLLRGIFYREYTKYYNECIEYDRMLHYDFSGIVWDQDMNPLQGVKVTLGYNEVVTDARGRYEMESPESAARPVFTYYGYEDPEAPHVVVMKPYEAETLNVQLREVPARIEGRVYDRDTNRPIQGASVTFYGKSAVSDANGNYSIEIPILTVSELTVRKTGYAPEHIPGIAASDPGQVIRQDVPMRTVGKYTISGTVYGKQYDHAQKKWVTAPLPGATVAWDGATAVSDADGKYEISVEEQPSKNMNFSKDPMYTARDWRYDGTVSEYAVKEHVDCTLTIRYGTLELKVHPEHTNSDGTADANTFLNTGIQSYSINIPGVVTDYSDRTVANLPIGKYTVTVKANLINGEEGFGTFTGEATVTEGKTASLDCELPWLRGLYGQLIDEDGSPISDMKFEVGGYKSGGAVMYDTYITPDAEGKFNLFHYDSYLTPAFTLHGDFVSMDYLEKNSKMFWGNPGETEFNGYQVRRTEGKNVVEKTLGVALANDETVTRGLIVDASWEGRSLHLEGEYNTVPKVYFLAADETVPLTVNASIGINGTLYSVSITDALGIFNDRLGWAVSSCHDENSYAHQLGWH